MPFDQNSIDTLLGGSHVAFKKRERPALSEKELDLKRENELELGKGISVLRKMRTRALSEQDASVRQNILREAHQLSELMADSILSQALNDKPAPLGSSYLKLIEKKQSEYAKEIADSGRGLPKQYSVGNLFKAVDDMLARIEKKGQSITTPDHKLSQEELIYVLHEFLRGTNDLSSNAEEKFFDKDTKIGGILTGGSVYLELVKKIVEKYGEPSLTINTFVIAVDKHNKKAVFESGREDEAVQNIILTDDIIDMGGTMLVALQSAGEQFPKATIHSGKGTDQPGGFEKRRSQKYVDHLTMLFQDFVELSDSGKIEQALKLFQQAENYARENKVTLQTGWYKRKQRIEAGI